MTDSEEAVIQKNIEMEASAIEGKNTLNSCNTNFGDSKLPYVVKNTFLCDECGKAFTTKSCLSVHLKAHKFTGHESLLKCDICEELFPGKASLARHKRNHQREFRCGECGKCFGKKANLEGHKLIHEGRQPYKCDTCGEEFAYKSLLSYHVNDHTGEKRFECNVCGQSFKSKGILKYHLLLHSSEKKFKCVICSKAFRYNRDLASHIRTHTKIMPVSCKICNGSFSSKKTLKSHMARHLGEPIFKCKLCLQGFDTKSRFLKHKSYHIAENQWKCLDCGVIFSSKALLISHKNKSHSISHNDETYENEGPCSCSFCGQNFRLRKNLKVHSKVHIAKDSWKCLICEEVFLSKDLLFSHRRKSHRKQSSYKCEFCNGEFSNIISFKTHKKYHVAPNEWKCHICAQIFSNLKMLQFHRKMNHKQKRKKLFFKCDFCDKVFTAKQKQKRHNEVHIGVQTWKCLACFCLLSDSESLKKHRLTCTKVNLKCNLCDATFTNRQSFFYHKKVHVAENCWKCFGCDETSPDRTSFITHGQKCEKSINVSLQKKWCQLCEKVFDKSNNYSQHKRIHVALNSWKCLTCDTLFPNKNSLKCHKLKCRMHKQYIEKGKVTEREDLKKNRNQRCKTCSLKIATGYHMSSHRLLHHVKRKIAYLCVHCGKQFTTKRALKIHSSNYNCKKSFIRKCFKCNKVFRSRLDLLHHKEKHKNSIHNKCKNLREKLLFKYNYKGNQPFQCRVCFVGLSCKTFLNYHSRIHNNSYRCDICSAKFKSIHSLVAHKNMHKSKKLKKCAHCFKLFKHKSCYISHMKGHDKITKNHVCKLCNARFQSEHEMTKHMGMNLFECKFCHKKFHVKKSLKAHKTVHISQFKWKCKDCGQIFLDERKLIIHYNVSHGILGKRKRKTYQNECSQCDLNKAHTETCSRQLVKGKCNCDNCRLKCYKQQIQNKNFIEVYKDMSKTVRCVGCEIEFNFMISLQEHNRRLHCKYSCYHCNLDFVNVPSYRNHMNTHEFGCGICKISLKKYCELVKHLKIHEIHHKCSYCGAIFEENSQYKTHLLAHESCKVICDYCPLSFQSNPELEKHLEVAHAPLYRIQNLNYCENCGKSFKTVMELQNHTRQTHKNLKDCLHFKTNFSSYRRWKNTILHFSSKQEFSYCNICRQRINLNQASDYCLLIINSLRPHVCMKCNKFFLQKKGLTEHLSIHGEFENTAQASVTGTVKTNRSTSNKRKCYRNETPFSTTKEIITLPLQKRNKETSVKKINCSIYTGRNGSNSNESARQNDVIQTMNGINEGIAELSLPQRNDDSSMLSRNCTIITGSTSENIKKTVRKSDTFQRVVASPKNTKLNIQNNMPVGHADICIERKSIPGETLEKTGSTRSAPSDFSLKEYLNTQTSTTNILLESNQDELHSGSFITIKSEIDFEQYSNNVSSNSPLLTHTNVHGFEFSEGKRVTIKSEIDFEQYSNNVSSSSPLLTHSNDHGFEFSEGNSEHNITYDLEDIKPVVMDDTDKEAEEISVKREIVTPFVDMGDGSGNMQQKCTDRMLENSHSNENTDSYELLHTCDLCQLIFPDRISKWIHQRIHENNNFPFKCELCSKKFCSMDALVRHQSQHAIGKPPSFYCCFCDESFSDEDTCKYHIKFRLCLLI